MSAEQPGAKSDSVPNSSSAGTSTSPTESKPSDLPGSPGDALDGCLWPMHAVLDFARNPLQTTKVHLATYAPERLLTRAALVYFIARAIQSILEPWYLRESGRLYQPYDADFRWLLGLVVWLASMIAWFAIVQMIWAGLRLIADAIRSTRRVSDDRAAWPPESKS